MKLIQLPSLGPSAIPSSSSQPSNQPSVDPSHKPSALPSASALPTASHSSLPSLVPSEAPSVSHKPTLSPSFQVSDERRKILARVVSTLRCCFDTDFSLLFAAIICSNYITKPITYSIRSSKLSPHRRRSNGEQHHY